MHNESNWCIFFFFFQTYPTSYAQQFAGNKHHINASPGKIVDTSDAYGRRTTHQLGDRRCIWGQCGTRCQRHRHIDRCTGRSRDHLCRLLECRRRSKRCRQRSLSGGCRWRKNHVGSNQGEYSCPGWRYWGGHWLKRLISPGGNCYWLCRCGGCNNIWL